MVSAYPEFETLYREVFEFRYHVKELVSVYSKILSEYDANTVKLMIEECREEAELMRAERDKAVKELDEAVKEPVSYTHLDVYKRQSKDRAVPGGYPAVG